MEFENMVWCSIYPRTFLYVWVFCHFALATESSFPVDLVQEMRSTSPPPPPLPTVGAGFNAASGSKSQSLRLKDVPPPPTPPPSGRDDGPRGGDDGASADAADNDEDGGDVGDRRALLPRRPIPRRELACTPLGPWTCPRVAPPSLVLNAPIRLRGVVLIPLPILPPLTLTR